MHTSNTKNKPGRSSSSTAADAAVRRRMDACTSSRGARRSRSLRSSARCRNAVSRSLVTGVKSVPARVYSFTYLTEARACAQMRARARMCWMSAGGVLCVEELYAVDGGSEEYARSARGGPNSYVVRIELTNIEFGLTSGAGAARTTIAGSGASISAGCSQFRPTPSSARHRAVVVPTLLDLIWRSPEAAPQHAPTQMVAGLAGPSWRLPTGRPDFAAHAMQQHMIGLGYELHLIPSTQERANIAWQISQKRATCRRTAAGSPNLAPKLVSVGGMRSNQI